MNTFTDTIHNWANKARDSLESPEEKKQREQLHRSLTIQKIIAIAGIVSCVALALLSVISLNPIFIASAVSVFSFGVLGFYTWYVIANNAQKINKNIIDNVAFHLSSAESQGRMLLRGTNLFLT